MITHPDFDNQEAFDTLKTLTGFYDSSWKNDTCPSIHHWIDEEADKYIQIFVDYKDPSKRESYGLSEFFVIVATDERTVFEAHTTQEVIDILDNLKGALS